MATFKEALEYAQKNPTSEFAKNLESGIRSGQYNQVAKSEGFDLSQYVTNQPQQSQEGVKGVAGFGLGLAKSVGQLATGTVGLAQGLGNRVIAAVDPTRDYEKVKQDFGIKALNRGTEENAILEEALRAKGGAEKFGKTVGDIGTFFVPAGEVASIEKLIAMAAEKGVVSKLAPLIGENIASKVGSAAEIGAKMGVRAGEGAAITAAQTNGDAKSVKDAAIISAVFPGIGKGVDAIAKAGKSFAPRIVNSLIKPLAKDLSYGKNPGRAIAEEGITASSLDDLVLKVGQRKQEIGKEIGEIVSTVKNKVITAVDAVKPLDEAIAQANKSPKTNSSLISRLESLKSDLFDGKKLNKMSVDDVFNLKSQVSDLTKFTGNASDDAIANKALKRIYGSLKGSINKAAGGLKSKSGKTIEELNERYADLSAAEIATKYRDAVAERANLISLPSNITGIGAGLIAAIASGGAAVPALIAGAGGIALEKAASTPTVKTKIAAWLAKSSPEEKSKLFKAIPALRGAVIKLFVGE